MDILIRRAHATHISIPNPWNVLAMKTGEATYRVELMDGGGKAVRVGTFNVDGSKGWLERDAEQSCEALKGKMDKASIYKVSPTAMTFRAYFQDSGYSGAAKLQWDLVPGTLPFPGSDCG